MNPETLTSPMMLLVDHAGPTTEWHDICAIRLLSQRAVPGELVTATPIGMAVLDDCLAAVHATTCHDAGPVTPTCAHAWQAEYGTVRWVLTK